VNDAAPYFSPQFPNRAQIKRAAFVKAQITALQARQMPLPPTLVREAQHADALFNNLAPHEQAIVSRTFNADIQQLVEGTHVAAVEREAQALDDKANKLLGELTQDMAGAGSRGLTMAQVGALRAGQSPRLRRIKLPTGAEADARVRQQTGMSLKAYEAKLDDLLVTRNMKFYSNPKAYEDALWQAFPGQDPEQADALVKNWATERVALEMRRRNERHQSDEVELKAQDGDERRLAVIAATIKHEASNPRSEFAKDQSDRLREIRAEGERDGRLDVRGALADAFLQHGGTMEVEHGNEPSQGEEIIEDYDNG
jgi:hypothetical protein